MLSIYTTNSSSVKGLKITVFLHNFPCALLSACAYVYSFPLLSCLCMPLVFRAAQKEVESSPSGLSGELPQRVQFCTAANINDKKKIANTLLSLFVSISAVQQCTNYFCLLAYVCDEKGLFVEHSVSAVVFSVLQFENSVFISYY